MSKMRAMMALTTMAAMAGMGLNFGETPETDHSVRDSKRMKLTPEESNKLNSLNGKEKKRYVKSLRDKYKC